MQHHVPKANKISEGQRRILDEYLEKINAEDEYSASDEMALQELSSETGLSHEEIKQYMQKNLTVDGTVNRDKKEFIHKYWKNRGFRPLMAEEKDDLQIHTDLSRAQVNQQLFVIRRDMHDATKYAGKALRQSPQPEQYSLSQQDAITLLHNWLKRNNFRQPSASERKNLQLKTGLTSSRLHHLLNSFEDPNGTLTQEAKNTIREWFQTNDRKTPTATEMSHLQQETQLSKQQIHRQLDILRDGNLESVTTQKKEIIEIWLLANKLRRPTQEEREILRQKVNL
eukprot:CAMPEP_0117456184 /NCGR_PEP_ID=MMETSP0759-20121206/11747_1 /TAXON_ID=63605 /ORGANISM="Percolomonas cosmopolitus, Strain WS" /LENGTH=282 /DNA_ID=CAMNT_0005249517 /DNA_START=299 /DNA_END=1143 /DNA_ORIENTATION=+